VEFQHTFNLCTSFVNFNDSSKMFIKNGILHIDRNTVTNTNDCDVAGATISEVAPASHKKKDKGSHVAHLFSTYMQFYRLTTCLKLLQGYTNMASPLAITVPQQSNALRK